ncbi:MAG: hypothetical protein KAS32_30085 [Candidatus Peribacteraceae bacterium]|nr:hypothetical protein [Candidatus Peribacteraceae bacterium]
MNKHTPMKERTKAFIPVPVEAEVCIILEDGRVARIADCNSKFIPEDENQGNAERIMCLLNAANGKSNEEVEKLLAHGSQMHVLLHALRKALNHNKLVVNREHNDYVCDQMTTLMVDVGKLLSKMGG